MEYVICHFAYGYHENGFKHFLFVRYFFVDEISSVRHESGKLIHFQRMQPCYFHLCLFSQMDSSSLESSHTQVHTAPIDGYFFMPGVLRAIANHFIHKLSR